ncbi:unnamed protein product [marine sediment metagenome]|uniref:Type II secretion system protein GspG C-terminal domain-containing protein n=1 Tax=marine sediment metagenome TaxID=412755 RepID=X1L083_9ZZZZ
MRLLKRGEKGFTLIELLIVVAILGVLAAVVIPNVGRFLGRGEEEARTVEYNTVRLGVTALMVENGLAQIPDPSHLFIDDVATSDMDEFPDTTATLLTKGADAAFVAAAVLNGDIALAADALPGYLLYGHTLVIDVNRDGTYDVGVDSINTVNTLSTNPLEYYYTCDAAGEIRQFNMADLTSGDLVEYTY